jgi:hypothetical protein
MTGQNTISDKCEPNTFLSFYDKAKYYFRQKYNFSLIAWLENKCKIGKLIIDIMPFLPLIN